MHFPSPRGGDFLKYTSPALTGGGRVQLQARRRARARPRGAAVQLSSWRLALESFEVVGLPPGSALAEAPPETAGADIVAEALRQLPATLQPRTRVRLTLPLPRPAAEDAAAPPPAAVPQLLAATTRLLQEQVLNSGG